ncbi:S-adenosyl-L-methionine-dependent methyltransferase [Lineolata rhizophorae]|uniref:S-adenosyl-L-methionine-dependent methyltransferase n=1 Tax=Lineolata rhizophorae TaxID=578093 RepID=A0A6A6NMM5_9PEZI|nr:S-adenosyl-L-methionine-dependent methyltransferase [Lineolata rhizophorae]
MSGDFATPSEIFVPRQATPISPEVYHYLTQDGTVRVAAHIFSNMLPPLPADAIIHDVGCGSGEAIEGLMRSGPPPSIKIYASDFDTNMVAACRAKAAREGWPLAGRPEEAIRHLDAANLAGVPDAAFTHAIINMVLHGLPEGEPEKAAKELYRTLRSGGVGVVTTGRRTLGIPTIARTSQATRGKGVQLKFPMDDMVKWESGERLKECLVSGGFRPEDIKLDKCQSVMWLDDFKKWTNALWSLLGRRAGDNDWMQEDEDKWDEALDFLMKQIQESDLAEQEADGRWKVSFIGNVAIATKP